MDDSYLSISFKVYPILGIEILIAELSLLEFELFEEKPFGLIAYIKSSEYSQTIFEKVKTAYMDFIDSRYDGMGSSKTSLSYLISIDSRKTSVIKCCVVYLCCL